MNKENELTIEQLIEGEIYVTSDKTPGYIFRCIGNCVDIPSVDPNKKYAIGGWLSSIGNSCFTYYRKATEKEKQIFILSRDKGVYTEPIYESTYEIY